MVTQGGGQSFLLLDTDTTQLAHSQVLEAEITAQVIRVDSCAVQNRKQRQNSETLPSWAFIAPSISTALDAQETLIFKLWKHKMDLNVLLHRQMRYCPVLTGHSEKLHQSLNSPS